MSMELNKESVEQAGTNVGHGHVFPRADGVKMRCGGPALCSECAADAYRARAALAQPSPAPELERPEVAEVAFVLRNIGAMDAEDIDGDNVDLRFEDAEGRDTGCDVSIVEYAEKAADLFEQHDRIVGALRAEITQLRQHKNDYMDAGQETYRALQNEIREREAEIARLDGLVSGRTAERDAALAEVERLRESKGDPVGSLEKCMKVMYERDEHAKRLEVALARVAELERQEPVAYRIEARDERGIVRRDCLSRTPFNEGLPDAKQWAGNFTVTSTPLYAAPVAQTQHSVPVAREQLERLVRILDAHNYAKDAEALMALLAAAPGNSAQHSVPDGAADLCRFLAKLYCELDGLRYSTAKLPAEQIADALIFKWPVLQGARNQLNIKRISEQPYDESKLHSAIAAMLAAAPGKEGV